MANKVKPQTGERSRVRFIVVDFDGASSDLQQLAQTFANAVRPPQQVLMPLPATAQPPALPHRQNGEEPGLFDQTEPVAVAEPAEVESALQRPQNGAKKRARPRTPVLLPDLNLTQGDVPFERYFQEQAPKEHSKRYLVIAQWLKEHRSINEVTADHVYTCYRFLSLSVPDDVLSVFRSMKKEGWVVTGDVRGSFTITHVGEKQLNHSKKE